MGRSSTPFVEWKEEFVSQERGSRVVHYILKDSFGESILAVVGTERSLRHMVYVVADEFLNAYGSKMAARGGYKWRSRREVVDWLTSMLCKQKLQDSPRGVSIHAKESPQLHDTGYNDKHVHNHHARGLRNPNSDIRWLGDSWTCSKLLLHYPAFCRNEITISGQSFVFVMAKEENQYVAYIEDMYEDKKGQKKVRVRWFHHSQEVKGAVRVRNAHAKEVFYTPYTQVISAECVNGPAIVLSRDHYEKYVDRFPHNLLARVHLCFRQFRTNKIKPFDLNKLKGYLSQPILSSLQSGTFLKPGSSLQTDDILDFDAGENSIRGTKRSRNYEEQQSFLTVHSGAQISGKKVKRIMLDSLCQKIKNLEFRSWHGWLFRVGVKIELLCQDSGIRGCWFRCTVLEVSRKQMKVQYDDVDDDDGCGKLEEWIRAFRLAVPDRLGVRCPGRPVVRPQPLRNDFSNSVIQVGVHVDAWWSDGWWEGVVTGVSNSGEKIQVYLPGENMHIDLARKDLRVSKDWVEGKWIDLKPKPDILQLISSITNSETELPVHQPPAKDTAGDTNCVDAATHTGDIKTQDQGGGGIGNSENNKDLGDSELKAQDKNSSMDNDAEGQDEDNKDEDNNHNEDADRKNRDEEEGRSNSENPGTVVVQVKGSPASEAME